MRAYIICKCVNVLCMCESVFVFVRYVSVIKHHQLDLFQLVCKHDLRTCCIITQKKKKMAKGSFLCAQELISLHFLAGIADLAVGVIVHLARVDAGIAIKDNAGQTAGSSTASFLQLLSEIDSLAPFPGFDTTEE